MRQASILMAMGLASVCAVAHAAPDSSRAMPPTQAILGRLWANMDLMEFHLAGTIKTPENRYAITLHTDGREMIYTFLDSPLAVKVEFKPGESKVSTRNRADDPWQPISLVRQREPVLNSDITFEELGLNFLNWPRIDPAGVDSINTLKAFAFDAYPQDTPTRYFKVRFWISAEHFVLLRVDAYNDDEMVIKRVEVNGVQKIDEAWMIKELAISTYSPGSTKSTSRTFIQIKSGRAQASLDREEAEAAGGPQFRAEPIVEPLTVATPLEEAATNGLGTTGLVHVTEAGPEMRGARLNVRIPPRAEPLKEEASE